MTRIDAATNTIVIGREEELLSSALIAREVDILAPQRFATPRTRDARWFAIAPRRRARRPRLADDGTLSLTFHTPLRAVTPGQLVALFDEDDEVLGAGTIDSVSYALTRSRAPYRAARSSTYRE